MTDAAPLSRMAEIMEMEQIANPLRKFGLLLLLVFLYCAFSRAPELYLSNLHLPLIFSTLAFAATVFSSGIQRALESSTGKMLILFTLWLIFLIPFSTWRTGSLELVKEDWSRSLLCYIMVAGLVMTIEECRQVMMALALASLTAAVVALATGATVEGRLALKAGHLSNPNDLAQALLLGLPFWVVLSRKHGVFTKVLLVAPMAIILVAIARTGSRAVMISVMVMCVLVLFFGRSSIISKLTAVVAISLALVLAVLVMPSVVRDRYLTAMSGAPAAVEVDELSAGDLAKVQNNISAVESREQRMALLKQSIILTLKHPIFGVGPGVFQTASADEFHLSGMRAAWLETHNAYTQVSCEDGIIGLLLFVSALGVCFRSLNAVRKLAEADRRFGELSTLANCTLLSLTGFAVSSFFSSIAYKFLFPTVMGLCIATAWSIQREIRRIKAADARNAQPQQPLQPAMPSGMGALGATPPVTTPQPPKGRDWEWKPEPETVYPPVKPLRTRRRPAWR